MFRSRTLVGILVGLVFLAVLPGSAATSSEGLTGQASFGDLQATGAGTVGSPLVKALNLFPSAAASAQAPWSLSASSLTVNWTHYTYKGVGWSPSRPDESHGTIQLSQSSGERKHVGGSASLKVFPREANFLLVPNGTGARLQATWDTELRGKPSPGEDWAAGRRADQSGVGQDPLRGTRFIPAGTAVFQTNASDQIHVRGDFTLYVWGAMANVTDAAGNVSSYRSGSWDENVIGGELRPRGVARDEHKQLLRLEVVDGSLVLSHWSGLVRMAAETLNTEIDGATIFHDAEAYLESKDFYYRTSNDSFEMNGLVSLTVRRSQASSSELSAEIYGNSVETTLPPTGPIPSAVSGPLSEISESSAQTNTQGKFELATLDPTWKEILFWFAAGLAVSLVGWMVHARRRTQRSAVAPHAGPAKPDDPNEAIRQAEEALIRGDSQASRMFIQGVLEKDPTNVDAWFVHGASLIQEGSFLQAVKDLEPIAKQAQSERPGLAFLLCLSFLRLFKLGKARRWAKVASADPDFRRQIELDETFGALRKRLEPPSVAHRLFAENQVPDPAYG